MKNPIITLSFLLSLFGVQIRWGFGFWGKSKSLALYLTGLIHQFPKAELFSIGNRTQTCSISPAWRQAMQGFPREWDCEGPKMWVGTVVKEACCQGAQYLFLGYDSTFQMKMKSPWLVLCCKQPSSLSKLLVASCMKWAEYLSGLSSCFSDRFTLGLRHQPVCKMC